jgi:hypothetical protein
VKSAVVFEHPTKGKIEVPVGFSWPACLLGPIWAIAKRLWLVCFLLVLTSLPFALVDLSVSDRKGIALTLVTLMLSFVYMYICGKFGNAWWRWTLKRRGFQPLTVDESRPVA